MTIQDALEKAVEGKVGLPFDLVRIVTQAEDVISPDLPEEVIELMAKKPMGKKTKKKRELLDGEPRKKRGRPSLAEKQLEGSNGDADTAPKPLFLKIRLPKSNSEPNRTQPQRVKEVDSDGDTVGGYSSDDAQSSLTSLSSRGSKSPNRRLPFPPRPLGLPPEPITTNDYLSSLARMDQLLGYDDTDVAYPSFHYSPLQPSSTGIYGMDDISPNPRSNVPIQPNLLHPDPTIPWRSQPTDALSTSLTSSTTLQPPTTRIRLRLPQQQHHQPTPQSSYDSSPNSTFLPQLPDLNLPTLLNPYDDPVSTIRSSSGSTVRQDHRSHISPIEGFPSLSNPTLAYSPTTPALEYSQNGIPYETTPYPWTISGLHDPPPYSHSPPSRAGGSSLRSLPVRDEMDGFSSHNASIGDIAASSQVSQPVSSASNVDSRNTLTIPDDAMAINGAGVRSPAGGLSTSPTTFVDGTVSQQFRPAGGHETGSTIVSENKLGLEKWNGSTLYSRQPNGHSKTSTSGLVDRRYHPDHL